MLEWARTHACEELKVALKADLSEDFVTAMLVASDAYCSFMKRVRVFSRFRRVLTQRAVDSQATPLKFCAVREKSATPVRN